MRHLKHLLPIFILLGFSAYAYQTYGDLPKPISDGLNYIPWLLIVTASFLSIHFNRSAVFFYTLLIGINFALFKYDWTASDLNYALATGFLPILMLIFSLLPERGVMSFRALGSVWVSSVLIRTNCFNRFSSSAKQTPNIALRMAGPLPAEYFLGRNSHSLRMDGSVPKPVPAGSPANHHRKRQAKSRAKVCALPPDTSIDWVIMQVCSVSSEQRPLPNNRWYLSNDGNQRR